MNCGKSAKISGFLSLISETEEEIKGDDKNEHEKVIDGMHKYPFCKIFTSFPCILRTAGL